MRDDAWALHSAHWLAGRCVVLHGPPPASIVAEPGWDELQHCLTAKFRFAEADDHDAYAALNCCRILRSLAEHDVVQSKFGSGWWALDHLPAEHAAAIMAAMNTCRGCATDADAAALAAGRRGIGSSRSPVTASNAGQAALPPENRLPSRRAPAVLPGDKASHGR